MSLQILDKPIEVYQDDFTPSKGNALQACVASIFGKTLNDVPNFITLDVGYEEGIREYVKDFYKVEKKTFDSIHEQTKDVGKICIVRGKSTRGDFGHVVVGKMKINGEVEMIHDPHPDNAFLDKNTPFGWYMVFN